MKLTLEQKSQLQQLLSARRAVLAAETREDLERVRSETYAEVAETNRAELSRDTRELWQVDAALERLSRGNYGACKDCGAHIGFDRLRAEPAAHRCAPCQRRFEA